MHAARQQGGSLDSVPGLSYPLSPPAHGVLQGGAFSSLLKQMAATAYSALGTVTCQASICSLIRTSFAISGNCPLSVQKLCYQALGAEPAGNLSCLTLPWPAEEPGAFTGWAEWTRAGGVGTSGMGLLLSTGAGGGRGCGHRNLLGSLEEALLAAKSAQKAG